MERSSHLRRIREFESLIRPVYRNQLHMDCHASKDTTRTSSTNLEISSP